MWKNGVSQIIINFNITSDFLLTEIIDLIDLELCSCGQLELQRGSY